MSSTGDIPASGPSPLQQRVTALEQQLAAERQKHGEARQLLQRTELAVRTLEVRTQHDALTQQEELDLARQATVRAQRGLDDALFEVQRRDGARRTARASLLGQPRGAPEDQAAMTTITTDAKPEAAGSRAPASVALPAKKRGRPRTRPLPEPKPVRWWTPSYKAGAKTKG